MHFGAKIRNHYLLLAVLLLSAGCSTDPSKQKLAYLSSGEHYAKVGRYREAVIEFRNAIQIDSRFADAHWKLAEAYLKLGNSEAAYREVTETVTLDPKNRDAQLQLSMLLLSRREYDHAQAAVQRILQLEPSNAQAHAILGEKYILTGDWQKAIRELQKAVEADPQRVEGYGALGAAYLAAGQPSDAEAAYHQAIAVKPKSVQAHVALGEFWFSQHRLAEAEGEMRTAAGLDDHALPPRLFLARILVSTGRLAEAEELYASLKTVAPQDPHACQALGLFYKSTGQKEKAAAEFQSLALSWPHDGSVKANLVETEIDLKRITEALAINQQILRQDPADPQALLSQGRILIAEGKWQEAASALERVVPSEPQSSAALYYLGVAQKSLGFVDLARTSFARSLQLAPRSSSAAAELASLDLKHGEIDEALRLTGKSSQVDSGSPSVRLARARALLAKGDTQRAEAMLQDLLKQEPLSLPALAMLLNIDTSQGKTSQAVERFSELVRRYPQNAGLHFLLALAYFEAKDLRSAKTFVSYAIRLDPKTPEVYSLLANVDCASGLVEACKTDFRQAIDANPHNVRNYLAIEALYQREGNWEEAKKLAEKAHQIDPDSPEAAGSLAFLYLEHGGDVSIAVSLAQMMKQKMPNSPVAADTLGWAYYRLGSPDSALAQLKEAVQMSPRNTLYLYHLGMAYKDSHHFELAQPTLQRALKDNPSAPFAASAKQALQEISAASQRN